MDIVIPTDLENPLFTITCTLKLERKNNGFISGIKGFVLWKSHHYILLISNKPFFGWLKYHRQKYAYL